MFLERNEFTVENIQNTKEKMVEIFLVYKNFEEFLNQQKQQNKATYSESEIELFYILLNCVEELITTLDQGICFYGYYEEYTRAVEFFLDIFAREEVKKINERITEQVAAKSIIL